MNKEIEKLIRVNMARDIELAMLKKESEGLIINKEIVLEILKEQEGFDWGKVDIHPEVN